MGFENWIPTIAGAVLGYALPYTAKFIQFIVGLPFRKELLEGTWHAYHFTRMHGVTIVRYEKWEIRRNLLNKLIIRAEDPKISDLKYRGFISVERNYLLVSLKGVKHKEEVQMRFFDTIPTGQDIAFGLAMGVDFDNKPKAHIQIMSRRQLSNKEAREILQSKTILKDNVIMGISE